MTKATVTLPYPPALYPLSLGCMAGIHSELEPEDSEDISLTKSWIVASHRPVEHTRASNEHKPPES